MRFSGPNAVAPAMEERSCGHSSRQPSGTIGRVMAAAIVAAGIVGCAPGAGEEARLAGDEPGNSIWLNPLKVESSTHRVTAKFQTFVCPNPIDLERAVALHNTGKVERMAAMGCRYLSAGDQGVRLVRIGRTQELLFETASGSVELWGFEGHYD